MSIRTVSVVDGNQAVASIAHRLNEIIAIYPITPSSAMGELSDEWSAKGKTNIWGNVPDVIEMQSEAGAAGAIHGALQGGALATTFTSSQGLLLMIPNLFKIAGELTPFAMHVAARTIATHALSIFGDHSDVMTCRSTGFAMLSSASVQEAHDFAAIAHATTLQARVPFLHFFDGFRTSHELQKIEELSDEDLRKLVKEDCVTAHRRRGMSPDRPVIRGTTANPDTFFQNREASNPYYLNCPALVQSTMDDFKRLTGRAYRLFDYVGDPQAERVLVIMGSGGETAEQTASSLIAKGEKVGVLKVRLYRPFSISAFLQALPRSTKALAVLDRTKEPGSLGEPLYLDILSAIAEARNEGISPFERDPKVIGGRYGLSSKEFTPAMVRGIFEELGKPKPKNHFTVGIVDDVTHTSLPFDPAQEIEPEGALRAVFFGLGSDGTVGANKNSIKILGEDPGRYVQGYFVYDSKKAGAMTVSHLRLGPSPIHAPYLIRQAHFVGCHQFQFLESHDVAEYLATGGTFLLNSPYSKTETWNRIPRETQEVLIEKQAKVFVIDANAVAREAGLGGRINTVMQTCFFALSGVLPKETAIAKIKAALGKSYEKKGREVVKRNEAAVDRSLENLFEVAMPASATSLTHRLPFVADEAPEFVKTITAKLMANKGDWLPVSAFPVDGTWPTGTTRWEKRNLATEIPVWDTDVCIQCNKCAMVCPHAAIRAKVYEPSFLESAPPTFKSNDYKGLEYKGKKYTIQVAPEDCTGCNLCVVVCPAKDKANPSHKAINMAPQPPLREAERENYAYFLNLPNPDRNGVKLDIKGTQFFEPLFEYSGACAGCGETPYLKLLTQLFGDRLLIANATGCSSIYGGNLPTTPYTTNAEGRGPAWANSLFEDNAEFGLGVRASVDHHHDRARALLRDLTPHVGEALAAEILGADTSTESGIQSQRARVTRLRETLKASSDPRARWLEDLADSLVPKSVWLVGGDGWAYDIGFGGLDHVLSTHRKVNVLVLDTEVYSNTGGQASKSTPLGAAAKFASAGKFVGKKDLGMMAMTYGHVYVARVAFGAKDTQTVRALLEAEAYPGPSLVIAYSHCVAHGYDLRFGAQQQKLAVDCGTWPLYRFDPRLSAEGKPPLQLDSGPAKIPLRDYMRNEARFRIVEKLDPKRFEKLMKAAERLQVQRSALYQQLSGITTPPITPPTKE